MKVIDKSECGILIKITEKEALLISIALDLQATLSNSLDEIEECGECIKDMDEGMNGE